jgi:glycosyltransferase involved in cell wall biosynthesis
MRVGIVTPAFNVAPYIGDAIRSVLRQAHGDWTMTIVDDGSTDATAEIAARFADPRLRLIRQSNAGVSAARNRGMRETQADALLFLDADDWLAPDALDTLVASLRSEPNAIAAIGAYWRVSVGGDPKDRARRPPSGDLLEPLLVRNLFANGGHLLIWRTVIDAAGPFHPGLRYGEDWEYWVRLARLGRFAAVASRSPLLFVRERREGAYGTMAARPESFVRCMDAIYNAPGLRARFGAAQIAEFRRRAEAENEWVIGRELIRHGHRAEGQRFLRRSVRAAPGIRRLALLAAGSLPLVRIGPFRRYSAPGTA